MEMAQQMTVRAAQASQPQLNLWNPCKKLDKMLLVCNEHYYGGNRSIIKQLMGQLS